MCFVEDLSGSRTFHLSISSVSQGLSVLCVEGILSVRVGVELLEALRLKEVSVSKKFQEMRQSFPSAAV